MNETRRYRATQMLSVPPIGLYATSRQLLEGDQLEVSPVEDEPVSADLWSQLDAIPGLRRTDNLPEDDPEEMAYKARSAALMDADDYEDEDDYWEPEGVGPNQMAEAIYLETRTNMTIDVPWSVLAQRHPDIYEKYLGIAQRVIRRLK